MFSFSAAHECVSHAQRRVNASGKSITGTYYPKRAQKHLGKSNSCMVSQSCRRTRAHPILYKALDRAVLELYLAVGLPPPLFGFVFFLVGSLAVLARQTCLEGDSDHDRGIEESRSQGKNRQCCKGLSVNSDYERESEEREREKERVQIRNTTCNQCHRTAL